LAGEPKAELCREFGISRKTGYKIFKRYQQMRVARAHRSEPTALPLSLRLLPGRRSEVATSNYVGRVARLSSIQTIIFSQASLTTYAWSVMTLCRDDANAEDKGMAKLPLGGRSARLLSVKYFSGVTFFQAARISHLAGKPCCADWNGKL
jgi:hypothetical protein